MKHFFSLVLLALLFSCTKDNVSPTVPNKQTGTSYNSKISNKDTINCNLININATNNQGGININTDDVGYRGFNIWYETETKPRFTVQGDGHIMFSDGADYQSHIYNAAGGYLTLQAQAQIDLLSQINIGVCPEYTDNTDAKLNGLQDGNPYRTGDILKIVHP